MSEYNNPRPLPTASASDPCTIVDNAISFDKVLNGNSTVTTYKGKQILSLSQAIDKFGFGVAPFTFTTGGTLESKNLLVSNDPVDSFLYKYVGSGSFPLTVTAGTNPTVGSDWQPFTATDHNSLSNRNAAGAHDASAVTTDGGGSVQDFIDQFFDNVHQMLSYSNHLLGKKYSTGGTTWEVVDVECGLSLGGGLYAEVTSETVCANDFGADKSGLVKINDALNDAADVRSRDGASLPVSFQPGLYNIDGFTRRVQAPNTNTGQERLVIIGPETPATALHQYMIPSVIFEGNGDIFLSVTNYHLKNIGIRNRLLAGVPVLAGKLITPYANGLEFGTLEGCYLGECNYHIYYDRTPTPDPSLDYTLDMRLTRTCFYGARISSRYINGYTAGYSEFQCYTSNCQNGLRLTQPGPCAVVRDSKFEYINDFAIDLELYGFTDNYSLALDNVFFETCGGGTNANIADYVGVERPVALPPIGLRTKEPNSSYCSFVWVNCHCTYTADNKPIAYVYMPSERFTVTARANVFSHLPVGGHIYSKSFSTYQSPWDLNILNSTPQGSVGYNTMNSLLIGDAGDVAINSPFQVSVNQSGAMWVSSILNDTYMTIAGDGHGVRFGSDDVNGAYMWVGGNKVFAAGALNAALLRNGGGITFKSPDGTVTKKLTIDNAGNPVWS